jgi:peptidoglycan/xylan/chitin deacetylase (PgdA/CDA1 family)
MIRTLALAVSAFLACTGNAIEQGKGEKAINSVTYQGSVYVSLDCLGDLLGGKTGFGDPSASFNLRQLRLVIAGEEWRFPEGGLRISKLSGKKEVILNRPMLILDGKHFVPVDECERVFGYAVEKGVMPKLTLGEKHVILVPKVIDSPFQCHRIENLQTAHEVVVTTRKIQILRSLYKTDDTEELVPGASLLIRRKVTLDKVPYVIVTDCGPSLRSYLIKEKTLRQGTAAARLTNSVWENAHTALMLASDKKEALQHGSRTKLKKSVCVTIDMCWSVRPFEVDLFKLLRETGRNAKRMIHPVVFISGRWMEQHPGEMHSLIDLDSAPNVEVTFGLHSWIHPKTGEFMNELSPQKVREDTLRLESKLLEWGIVPTVYYRFPGLVHDTVRLREILSLDLLPIDCESWMALLERKNKGPFAQPIQNGSIILVHGNGNEPDGIPPLQHWFKAHGDWELRPLADFVSQK